MTTQEMVQMMAHAGLSKELPDAMQGSFAPGSLFKRSMAPQVPILKTGSSQFIDEFHKIFH